MEEEEEDAVGRVVREVDGHERRKRRRKKKTTTEPPPTTTLDPNYDYDYYNDDEYAYDTDADAIDRTLLLDGYWDVACLNRTFDENFKTLGTKMNTNHSTMHIPVNVFKQSMAINMTAFWSEQLNGQFQVRCSSHCWKIKHLKYRVSTIKMHTLNVNEI